MENKAKCQNCGGSDFYRKNLHYRTAASLIYLGWFTESGLTTRVCGDCGLVTWFVPKGLLPKVKEKFEPDA